MSSSPTDGECGASGDAAKRTFDGCSYSRRCGRSPDDVLTSYASPAWSTRVQPSGGTPIASAQGPLGRGRLRRTPLRSLPSCARSPRVGLNALRFLDRLGQPFPCGGPLDVGCHDLDWLSSTSRSRRRRTDFAWWTLQALDTMPWTTRSRSDSRRAPARAHAVRLPRREPASVLDE